MGARTIEVKASHLSLISHPDEIARLILEAAGQPAWQSNPGEGELCRLATAAEAGTRPAEHQPLPAALVALGTLGSIGCPRLAENRRRKGANVEGSD
jgi:hypothetical protein